MAERGPLPKLQTARRNKKPATGKAVITGRPAMPSSLSSEAKAEWRRLLPELEQMGILTKVDRGLLIRYCTVWSDWVELNANLQKTGKLIKGRDGGYVRNPLWLMRSDAESALSDLARQIGIGPMARIRAGFNHEKAEQTVASNVPPDVADFEAERRRRLLEEE